MQLRWKLGLKVSSMKVNSMLQGAVWDAVGKKWYLSQAQPLAGGQETTVLRRFSATGTYEGYCKLTKWGHGSFVGVRTSSAGNPWVWVPVDASSGSDKKGVSRVIFTKGATFSLTGGSTKTQFYGDKLGNGGFGLSSGFLYLRDPHADTETYRQVDEQAFLRREPKVVKQVTLSRAGRPGPFQGCTASNSAVFVVSGATNEEWLLDRIDWHGSLSRFKITPTMARQALGGHVTSLSSVEPEGLQFVDGKLLLGIRSGPTGVKRDFSLVEVTL